ncbi:MAG TPA: 50S ribosomal protein L11 methyltransferase [Micromonosporaceae bacterium]|nr:50S ribosomal protein L11 methyltransferase [Micromonosporaceae bacterium]
MVSAEDAEAFVREHSGLAPVAYVPEVRTYQADDAMALWERTEERDGAPGVAPPFWAFPWAGGQALARYVIDHPAVVAGRNVLDIAAGSGLVGLAASVAGAATVVANEIDPYAIAAIRLNAAANRRAIRTYQGNLVGGDGDVRADVVLAGDVFYNQDMAAAMLAFFQAARARGADVLVGDPGRAYVPFDDLDVVTTFYVPVIRDLEDMDVKPTMVWRVR